MNEDGTKSIRVLKDLERAVEDWNRHGNEQSLTRWMERELNPRGIPINLPVADWLGCVNRLLSVTRDSLPWPSSWNASITRLIQATRWFARADGHPVFEFDSSPRDQARIAKATSPAHATGSNGHAIDRMIARIMPRGTLSKGDDASAAWGGKNRVLEVLRPGWPAEGNFLAVDHRDRESTSRFELFGAGRSWLGPTWKTEAGHAAMSTPRPRCWVADSSSALVEWSYRAGDARITQSALILANRSLALLSTLVEYPTLQEIVPEMILSLWPQITTAPIENCRGVTLKPTNSRGSAQVLPIGLPSLPYQTERGEFLVHHDELVVKPTSAARRVWLPLVVSWDAKRHRKEVRWRVLSVSEKRRNVAPERAFAARLSWGRDETYIVYRSLAKPAPRAFLGHQTSARFLVGLFNRDGVVEPILKVD